MSKHSKCVIPFGKWKGFQLRHVPPQYLSWLQAQDFLMDPKWAWLLAGIEKELRACGAVIPPAEPESEIESLTLEFETPRVLRRITVE
jgi:uncharacterized protein (DUF3820 family)